MRTAVLISGGLDSVVLLAQESALAGRDSAALIQPVYVSTGLAWEPTERAALAAALAREPLRGRTRPLVSLSVDMRDVYPVGHWAIEGRPPGYHTADEEVYLPGRNVVLLGKAGAYCATEQLDRVVLGTLAHNPFPDATPAFRRAMADALSLGLARPLRIDAPFASMGKADVIRLGASLGVPFEATLSCMNPPRSDRGGSDAAFHCGVCSKCRERHEAFVEAGVGDPTSYRDRRFVEAAQ
jgi:7-cyano-7-deazaguanine synthase